jgi:glutathione S-transferase
LPLGSVPVMDVDGLRLTQTGAMLRYVGRLSNTGLYPTDPFEAFVVDSCVDTFNDTVSNALTPSMFERDMAKKLEMRVGFVAGPLTQACRYVEGLIARSGGPFLLGQTLTIADLLIASQVLTIQSGRLDGITADVLAPYPLLRGVAEAYVAHPRIQAYQSK